MTERPFSCGTWALFEKLSPVRRCVAARRLERGNDWSARNAGDLVSQTQLMATLEPYQDEHRTTEKSEDESDDACFYRQAVLRDGLDSGLLQDSCCAGSRATRKLRVGDLASDPVELQGDLVLFALQRPQKHRVLLPRARSGAFDGNATRDGVDLSLQIIDLLRQQARFVFQSRDRSASVTTFQLADVGHVACSDGIRQVHGVATRRFVRLNLQDLPTDWRHRHQILDCSSSEGRRQLGPGCSQDRSALCDDGVRADAVTGGPGIARVAGLRGVGVGWKEHQRDGGLLGGCENAVRDARGSTETRHHQDEEAAAQNLAQR